MKKTLRKIKIGESNFLIKIEKERFEEILKKHEKTFAFETKEIRYMDSKIVLSMVIFTIPHIPWELKPISVPRAMILKVIEILKEKMKIKILKQSIGPYSSRWFILPKISRVL